MTDTEAIADLNGLTTEANNQATAVQSAYANFDASKTALTQAQNEVNARLTLMDKRVRYVINRYGEGNGA